MPWVPPRFFPLGTHPKSAPFVDALRRTGPQHGRLVPSRLVDGQRLWTVGSQTYLRPPTETFHGFLVFLVKSTVNERWYVSELERPESERHELARWLNDVEVRVATLSENPAYAEVSDIPATGADLCVLTLGYDLLQVLNQTTLAGELRKRLRTRDKFQGARYEIAVAATFVRAGLGLSFINDKSRKRPEFMARDPSTGFEVEVEAKSRHLAGVLHEPGLVNMAKAMRGEIDHLIREASRQSPRTCPFMIFVDLNVPSTRAIPLQLRAWMQRFEDSTYETLGIFFNQHPEVCSGVVLTSFPWHWESATLASGAIFLLLTFDGASYPLPPDVVARLKRAMDDYGEVPMEL